jgi:hypothetical protein
MDPVNSRWVPAASVVDLTFLLLDQRRAARIAVPGRLASAAALLRSKVPQIRVMSAAQGDGIKAPKACDRAQ